MITYRQANSKDYTIIARLHAESWKANYRGMVSKNYLNHSVDTDRLEVWRERMAVINPLQFTVLASDGSTDCGFVCTFLDHDKRYGALLDNLHVLQSYQGHGIGKELMRRSALWVGQERPQQPMYLWVLAQNEGAKRFYEKLGGELVETVFDNIPGGGKSMISRYLWNDLTSLF